MKKSFKNLNVSFILLFAFFFILGLGLTSCGGGNKDAPVASTSKNYSLDELKIELPKIAVWSDDNEKKMSAIWKTNSTRDVKLVGLKPIDISWSEKELEAVWSTEQKDVLFSLGRSRSKEDQDKVIAFIELQLNDQKTSPMMVSCLQRILFDLKTAETRAPLLTKIQNKETPYVVRYSALDLLLKEKKGDESSEKISFADAVVATLAKETDKVNEREVRWSHKVEEAFMTLPVSYVEKTFHQYILESGLGLGSGSAVALVENNFIPIMKKWWSLKRGKVKIEVRLWSDYLAKGPSCDVKMIGLKVIEQYGNHRWIPFLTDHKNDCDAKFQKRVRYAMDILKDVERFYPVY